ncbi:MAG: hypothetical protein J1F02_02640 [Lachnospiraceae bacterium]|nr:hypothetical protein [Lachnospiraceae bacterium]
MKKSVVEVIAEVISETEIGSMLMEDVLMEMADAIYARLQKEGLIYELIEDSVKSRISNIRDTTEDFLFTPGFESGGQWPPAGGSRVMIIILQGWLLFAWKACPEIC